MTTSNKKISANRKNAILAGIANKKEKVEFICLGCNQKSLIHLCLLKRGRKYCSWLCRTKYMKGSHAPNSNGGSWMKGASNPNWKAGISKDHHRESESGEQRKWRIRVYERDNYTCQKCKIYPTKQGQLNAHHIIPWSVNYYVRYDLNNGITLCIKCHKEIHKNGWENFPNPEYVELMLGFPRGWTEVG